MTQAALRTSQLRLVWIRGGCMTFLVGSLLFSSVLSPVPLDILLPLARRVHLTPCKHLIAKGLKNNEHSCSSSFEAFIISNQFQQMAFIWHIDINDTNVPPFIN
jgi:hypothetical protein